MIKRPGLRLCGLNPSVNGALKLDATHDPLQKASRNGDPAAVLKVLVTSATGDDQMSTVILSLAAAGFKPFFSISQQDKPEPSVLGMMALGGLSLVMASRRRRFRGIWPRRASRTQRPVILELGTPPSAGQLDGPKTRALPQSNIFPKTNKIFTESSGDSVLGKREAGQRPPPPRGGDCSQTGYFQKEIRGSIRG